MAKTPSKTSTPKVAPKAAPKAKAKPQLSTSDVLEQASEEALTKLKSLGLEEGLQSELEWCLGSYRFDRNPSGLREVAGRVLTALAAEKEKKTKGVTAKLVGDLEKALKA
jgi:hypothetical protein